MLVRSNILPKNQSAGRVDAKPLRMVHHRPPKNIAPSKTPASRAGTRLKVSLIVVFLFLSHLLVFLVHPVPGIQAADCRSEEHTSELQSLRHLVCRLLLDKKK